MEQSVNEPLESDDFHDFENIARRLDENTLQRNDGRPHYIRESRDMLCDVQPNLRPSTQNRNFFAKANGLRHSLRERG